jgi:putative transposase
VRYRSANKAAFSAKCHLVWCSKYRRRVLGGEVEERLKEVILEVAERVGAEVLEVEVMPDHVQLLKGRSSRRLELEFLHLRRLPALWSPSWFVSTVGGAPLHVVGGYVENQKRAA